MHLPEETASYELPPEGVHPAVCFRVIDQGTQPKFYQGKENGSARKVLISWELCGEELMKDGRRFTFHQTYSFSMNRKAKLRQHLESWRSKKFEEKDFGPNGFNIRNLIGKGCLLTITHNESNGNEYANLTSITNLLKGMETPLMQNDQVYFCMEDMDMFNETRACLEGFGENLRSKIEGSPEYKHLTGGYTPPDQGQATEYPLDDDIPF